MSPWYLVAFVGIFAASWWVSELYSRKCLCRESHQKWHGALEFNATLFSLLFLLLWFVTRSKDGSWVMGAIGLLLAMIVARRFWINWKGHQ